ncbi:MAG: DDE-type integrase/transposase/recombinase [Planctomycetes bacterium]|nr:DDE-type integrase/transposase/recombinase [Planctomycetota bacterium]
MIDSLQSRFVHLSLREICTACSHSRSQLYKWCQAATLERKVRQPKALDEYVLENTAKVIITFPHFGGGKGQAFMLYHGLGLIGQKAYDSIKKKIKRLLCQEVSQRKDLPVSGEKYEHIRPEWIGQIWAEDFTEVVIDGISFKLALLIDVFSQYILGWALARRATESLVAIPVHQALAANAGKPPEKFLLRDNGTQYISENHNCLLDAHEIVGRHIPAYTPQYNGAVECGGKEFKNVFYNVWERRKRNGTDKEKTVDDRAQLVAAESVHLLNEVIPRPALGGVTPADFQRGRQTQRQQEIKQYRQEQEARGTPPPFSRPLWDVLKGGVKAEVMSTKELLTKLAFFGMRPLRRVAQLNREVWGN